MPKSQQRGANAQLNSLLRLRCPLELLHIAGIDSKVAISLSIHKRTCLVVSVGAHPSGDEPVDNMGTR